VERGDLGTHTVAKTAVVFEGVIATPPKGWLATHRQGMGLRFKKDWGDYINAWAWHEVTLASINRLGYQYNYGVEVVTLLPEEAVGPIMNRFQQLRSSVLDVTSYPSLTDLVIAMRLGEVKRVWDSDTERLIALGWLACGCQPGAEITLG
jgi:hypothetical protein